MLQRSYTCICAYSSRNETVNIIQYDILICNYNISFLIVILYNSLAYVRCTNHYVDLY